jgi:5-methylcytosine-specific restriction endonuclease McrA
LTGAILWGFELRIWEVKKTERMRIDGYRCACCGRHISHYRTMQVHYVTYDRSGHEKTSTDLCKVCESCHKKLHNYYNRKR